jgi:hypothetical protein
LVSSSLLIIIIVIAIGSLFYPFYHAVDNVIAAPMKQPISASSDPPNNAPLLKRPAVPHGMSLKIVSPGKGQRLPVGSNLTITGTSSDNSTSNCQVSLMLNDLKPYQKTTPTGKGSQAGNDYSTWRYVMNNSTYGSVNEGINKITSKLTCANPNHSDAANNALTKWYSINITGISAKSVEPGRPLLSKSPVNYTLNRTSSSATSPTNSSKASSLQSVASVYKPIEPTNIGTKTNTTLRTMAVSLNVGKDPITTGQRQTVKVIVTDSVTASKLAGAKVITSIQPLSSSSMERQFVGLTGPDGMLSRSWKMADEGKFSTAYNIYGTVSAAGYENKSISGTFREIPPQNTFQSVNSKVNDLSTKIFDEVKKGFDQNGLIPKLPIPFN